MKTMLYVYQNYTQSYSSAALSILRGFKELKNLNLDVFEIKPITYHFNINRVLNRIPLFRSFHFRKQNKLLLMATKNRNYDYLFVNKGTDIHSTTLQAIKKSKPGIQLICFNPDDPFNLASSNSEIIKSIKIYDFYCIWTRLLNQKLHDAGAKKVVYFPFGIDDKIIYPVKSQNKYDISFIGNGDGERHRLIGALAAELKNRGLNTKVHVFGSNWPLFGEQVMIHNQQNGMELLKTIAATKINLNLLRKQNKNSINMRTFEIPAAGGFMLHEKSEEAEQFFTPNKEVVYFDGVKNLVDLCEIYLRNEELRLNLISNSLFKIKQGAFSYKNIIEESLNEFI